MLQGNLGKEIGEKHKIWKYLKLLVFRKETRKNDATSSRKWTTNTTKQGSDVGGGMDKIILPKIYKNKNHERENDKYAEIAIHSQ